MNWDEAQREARRYRATLKNTWPALSEDDLQSLQRHKDVFLYRLQRRVGGELRDLERQFDALLPPKNDRGTFGVIFTQAVWSGS